ncbi:hypothetical protein LTR37_002869 [Vermiconidia calcicola]|uniref:Uncharacterized protein n=1 Tax=Vermiconidia calcicola TaxID=1690605 RepID=A0ACC3NR82_9PEZI|nr:hypothetical protein LTR37_002869 [Vermiconidia calcicola]
MPWVVEFDVFDVNGQVTGCNWYDEWPPRTPEEQWQREINEVFSHIYSIEPHQLRVPSAQDTQMPQGDVKSNVSTTAQHHHASTLPRRDITGMDMNGMDGMNGVITMHGDMQPILTPKPNLPTDRDMYTAGNDPATSENDTPTPNRAPLPAADDTSFPVGAARSPSVEDGSWKFPKAKQNASTVAHVGLIHPTRRSILLRADRPYICALCGSCHLHPWDVKFHFRGHNGTGCWYRHGTPKGAKWDRHASCSVLYPDINYTKVREGYVVLDQRSLDEIERACDAGRKFKEENGEIMP